MIPFVCKMEISVLVPWLASRYVSQLDFTNLSFTWSDLQEKQKWSERSFVEYSNKRHYLYTVLTIGKKEKMHFVTAGIRLFQYTTFIIGYAICVAVGILFMIVVPIVACCFCCCRCCCKKFGGRMVQSDEDSKNIRKKWIYVIMILIVMIFLL